MNNACAYSEERNGATIGHAVADARGERLDPRDRRRRVWRRDGDVVVVVLEWLGLLARAGILIAIAGLGFATLGLLHS